MKGKLAVGILLAASAFGGIANAQTISYADAMTELTRDCGTDVKKLCRGVNLGNGQLADCLEKHRERVSPQCVSTLAADGLCEKEFFSQERLANLLRSLGRQVSSDFIHRRFMGHDQRAQGQLFHRNKMIQVEAGVGNRVDERGVFLDHALRQHAIAARHGRGRMA